MNRHPLIVTATCSLSQIQWIIVRRLNAVCLHRFVSCGAQITGTFLRFFAERGTLSSTRASAHRILKRQLKYENTYANRKTVWTFWWIFEINAGVTKT
jgi:hypothetical protein